MAPEHDRQAVAIEGQQPRFGQHITAIGEQVADPPVTTAQAGQHLFELGSGQSAEALSAWLTSRYPDSWCVSSAQFSLLWCRPASVQVDNPRLLEKLDGSSAMRSMR